MSYILEALKKSQAERQLGALPTIHATTLHGGEEAGSGARLKKPLWLALIAMAVVIVVLLALVWRQAAPAAAPMPAQAPVAAVAVAGAAAPAVGVAPDAGAGPAVAPLAAVPAGSHPATASASARAPSARPAAISSVRSVASRATPVDIAGQPTPAAAAQGNSALPAAAPAADAGRAAAATEQPVQTLRDLPEPIQRAIPPITVGGYIYSRNPADRLLLIDKVLRHEGEELAPGLVLEKLLPRAAIFNYKGYRYRVGY